VHDALESECARLAPRLPPQWSSSFNSHSFVYAHTQSSMQFIIKIDRLGGKAEIRGLAVGDERIVRFEITARDYISSAALPLRISKAEDGSEDRSDLQEKLKKVFISEERMTGTRQHLTPWLTKLAHKRVISLRSCQSLKDQHYPAASPFVTERGIPGERRRPRRAAPSRGSRAIRRAESPGAAGPVSSAGTAQPVSRAARSSPSSPARTSRGLPAARLRG
jgi:hypothetical protein